MLTELEKNLLKAVYTPEEINEIEETLIYEIEIEKEELTKQLLKDFYTRVKGDARPLVGFSK